MLSQFISRHFKRVIAPIASLSLALLLAACNFEMSGEVNVGADGSGEIVSSIAFPKQEYQMLPSNQKSNFCGQFNEQGKLGKVELVSRGEKVLCLFKKPFKNIKQLKEDGFKVKTMDDGTVELSIDLTTIASAMGLKGDKNLQQASQRGKQRFTWQQHNKDLGSMMNMAMLADKSLNITVNAPHIVETNGIVSEDRKLAEYGVSLMEIVGKTKIQHYFLRSSKNFISHVAFSPNGHQLATSEGVPYTVKILSLPTGKLLHKFSGGPQLLFSPDGRLIATYAGEEVQIRDVATGKLLHSFTGQYQSGGNIAFSPNGQLLAIDKQSNKVEIWDMVTGVLKYSLTTDVVEIYNIIFSPDGRLLAIAGDSKAAEIWDAVTGKQKYTLTGHLDSVYSVKFSPDSRLLATTSSDNTAKIWHVATGNLQNTFTGHSDAVQGAQFTINERFLVTQSADNTAKIWDVVTGKLRGSVTAKAGGPLVQNVAISSPDATLLATINLELLPEKNITNTAKIWDVVTGKLKYSLIGHSHDILYIAFSPDGRQLATASGNGAIGIWQLPQPPHFKTRFYCYKHFWGSKGC